MGGQGPGERGVMWRGGRRTGGDSDMKGERKLDSETNDMMGKGTAGLKLCYFTLPNACPWAQVPWLAQPSCGGSVLGPGLEVPVNSQVHLDSGLWTWLP